MANSIELSERERDILRHVATGLSNKEIARKLDISTNTVKVHLRNIFAKLEVMSRTEATLYAIEHHIVEAPGNQNQQQNRTESSDKTPVRKYAWIIILISLLMIGILPLTNYLQSGDTPEPNPEGALTSPARWELLAPLPSGRAGMASVAYENQIYIFSGMLTDGLTNTSFRYDIQTNQWESIANKPIAVRDSLAAQIGEKVYIPGGYAMGVRNELDIYNPRTDTWEGGASLPQPRSGYALATLEGRIYIFGGWDGTNVTDTIYTYDPDDDHWVEMGHMPFAGAYMGAIASGNKIYLIGGWDGTQCTDHVHSYMPVRDVPGDSAWSELPTLPDPACQVAISELSDIFFVIGAHSKEESITPGDNWMDASISFYEYHLQSSDWVQLESPTYSLGTNSAMVSSMNHLYILGGYKKGALSTDNQSYVIIYTSGLPILISP